jgi:hypothetical protein
MLVELSVGIISAGLIKFAFITSLLERLVVVRRVPPHFVAALNIFMVDYYYL